ncbi:hypothetical protein UFOVP1146_399 [uncultured Caudovirales phage]|uniref:Gp5/Type VI secretion system Vgr protein OB-fold domain-containing protein n=1 Tax=uncultured Caudovirales phage TaxID=2100421 RepID=A0A6J5P366_9CAUD|nr:hypothetical protein UFOVP812_312 [uncultured Caudovirales phage]CAB4165717.1 hypothetical protein UFOVP818_253 [uncultured Caudovirales phage]CAB4187053.1 hypothetical protein UFOVP1146_399 [uncultured Caudovirales phage]CAB4221128.1 hypothetical protein UFOVP1638_166 [uncultured Caudovirales phage]
MAYNSQRSRGRPAGYKYDRGGVPAEMGPFIGIVVNNVDNTRSGRLQVLIEEFASLNPDGTIRRDDTSLWRTVSYCPPFYGVTPFNGDPAFADNTTGVGTFPGNSSSYGMWFTPPDLGVSVLCFFVGGDPSAGYYTGCIPEAGINHMIPAIGASSKYSVSNNAQADSFVHTKLLPVTEINDYNPAISDIPRFFDQIKPVQSIVAAILFQQGLDRDIIRGPIRSSSQRESPSTVYGISTPGKAIYAKGLDPKTIRGKLERNEVNPQDVNVIGRQGGHTFVMDDGDLDGADTLIRIRTAKGHQITMSDDGDCFFITHANGQTWMEFGKQGTVDVFSTNSVNIRTQGTLNLHADKDINMYAGGKINIKSKDNLRLESDATMTVYAETKMLLYSKTEIGINSGGKLGIKSKQGGWNASGSLNFKGSPINLNGGSPPSVTSAAALKGFKLADTSLTAQGWIPQNGTLSTIVTRAPTHCPYPYANQGVNVTSNLTVDSDTATTAAGAVPAAMTTVVNATNNTTVSLGTAAATVKTVISVDNVALVKPLTVEAYIKEPPANQSIG